MGGRAGIGRTGNAQLRTARYLATLRAAQHNPAIKPFYDRRRAAGKPQQVARCAASLASGCGLNGGGAPLQASASRP